jgi:PAS domain S-box-containing protein
MTARTTGPAGRSDQPVENTRGSAQDLAAILDHFPSVVSLWDRDLRNRFMNWACVDWLNELPGDLIGVHLRDMLDADMFAANLPHINAVLDGEPQVFERTFFSPSGATRHTQVNYTPYVQDGLVVGFFGLLVDISAQVQADLSRRDIANRIAVIDERARIAGDMEEAVIGRLSGVCSDLSMRDGFAPATREAVISATQLIEATVAELRSSIYNHRRIDAPDELAAAVHGILATASRTMGFAPDFVIDGSLDRVNPAVGAELLAVLIESLSNIARHAAARSAQVEISTAGSDVTMTVTDDGRGIVGSARKSGLANMQARAERLGGQCTWAANEPTGTTVEWRVPADRRAVQSGVAGGARHARRATDPPARVDTGAPPPVGKSDGVRLTGAELLEVLDHIPAAVTVWDRELRNLFANRAGVAWFGKQHRAEVEGRQIKDLLDPEIYRANLPFAESALAGRSQLFERAFVDPDGVTRHTRVTYSSRFVDGEVTGIFVEVSDVTNRVEAEAELRHRTDEMTVLQERRRIAEDLHDLVIQHLFAAGLKLHAARDGGGPGGAARIEAAITAVDAAIDDLRASIVSLNTAGR